MGHDRGAYTAFRTAMDHPASVSRLAILEAIPIGDALARCDARFASAWWHWFFFALTLIFSPRSTIRRRSTA
ncbi:hypothetical protein [Mesorhizobium sp. M0977]|uniref:hypothetical protein n=1 Tax=Mesorhizobium sp. M0977 TaxID=2957039 RepID=UPI003334B538